MSGVVIKKSEERERMVWAEVYAPNRPDSGGDFMTAEEIKKAAYQFMKNMRLDQIDSQHNNELVEGAFIVESFIARKDDPHFIEGAWVVGMHVDNDEMWEKIEKGEINGFSLEAIALGEDVEVEVEIPPVVSGTTSETAGHRHTFYVSYDEDGNFLGGKTSIEENHFHVIKAGTITELVNDHNHKFSAVDELQIVQ